MTVGTMTITILSGIVVLFVISITLYQLQISYYRKNGYKDPKSEADYEFCIFLSFLIVLIGILVFKGCEYVILNWNVPV